MRAKHVAGLALACCATLLLCSRSPADDESRPTWPTVVPHELLQVAASPTLTAERHQELMRLVDSLAGMRDWDDVTESFPPASVDTASEGTVVANPGAGAYRTLIALGSEAIPVLLARLDDRTATGLSFRYGGIFGELTYARGLDANLADPVERDAIRRAYGPGWALVGTTQVGAPSVFQPESTYTATIGDISFSILGVITARDYILAPGRSKNAYTVCSPTHDPRIAQAVRAQWEGKDARRELVRRLASDFHTGWGGAGEFILSGRHSLLAIERLLVWFGPESEAMLAARLDEFDAPMPRPAGAVLRLDVELVELCETYLDSQRAALIAAVERFAVRTRRSEALVRILPRLTPAAREKAYPNVEAALHVACRQDHHGRWIGELLQLVLEVSPPRNRHALEPCLVGTVAAARILAWASHRHGLCLPAAAWAPWLVGDALLGWPQHLKAEEEAAEDLPRDTLLRDAVAALIARERVDLPFDLAAERADRDRAIQHMRRVLAEEASR